MKLFSRIVGEGKPLIILHGLFGLSDNWVSLAKKFADNYQVHILDLRNHGQSPHSDVFNYFALVEDVLEYIEDYNLKDYFIIGHSMGGKTAMGVAISDEKNCKKLLVVDIAPKKYALKHISELEAMLSIDFSITNSRKEIEIKLKQLLKDDKVIQLLMKNLYWREKETLDWRINLKSISNNISYIFDYPFLSSIYNTPTLFIKGQHSDYIVKSDEEQIKYLFPQSKLVEFPNAKHWVHVDNPDLFYITVTEFFG